MVSAGFFGVNFNENIADRRSHVTAITAQENLTTLGDNIPYGIARDPHGVLNITMRMSFKLRIGHVEINHTIDCPVFHFAAAQPVMLWMSRTKEDMARCRRLQHRALLNKSAQRRKACAGTDQDERDCAIMRRGKRWIGTADIAEHAFARLQIAHMRRCKSLMRADP